MLRDQVEKKRILIVGDELEMRIFLCNLLGNCGFATVDAGNGSEGMRKAKCMQPSLIIIDAMLPREDGIRMYRELRSEEAFREVPVIMVSAIEKRTFFHYHRFQNAPDGRDFPKPGAYLEKPLEADKLVALVQRLIDAAECGGIDTAKA